MIYHIAEKFKSVQGEGMYTGTPMAFIRFVGCSVGKKICQHCDTDFEQQHSWHGGGSWDDELLAAWVHPYTHVCLTGGEPLDQLLQPLVARLHSLGHVLHIETSGTVLLNSLEHGVIDHICVSPKPGYLPEMIERADEIKVIVPGLGNGEGWPTKGKALQWAGEGKIVFLQPRNAKFDVNQVNLSLCEELVRENPSLRLSIQTHKLLRVR